MAILQTMEKTDLWKEVESFVGDLGAQILFWREVQTRSMLKVELTLFASGGVGMDLIEKVHRLLLPRLEALVEREVTLDISSPGVNRILKSLYELPFFEGRALSFVVKDLGSTEGVLVSTSGDAIVIKGKDGTLLSVLKEQITQAKLI